jgi:hypothetical protein
MNDPIRDPELTKILDRAKGAIAQASSDDAKLSVIASAASQLQKRGDDGSDPFSDLSDFAVDVYGSTLTWSSTR